MRSYHADLHSADTGLHGEYCCLSPGARLKSGMANKDELLTPEQVEVARKRRLEAQHLQLIEGNPLDAEDIAMFEMFERERWSHERCRQYIIEQALASKSQDK
ncbi:hypothetical protein WGT02_03755 [Rhizobium sp. T1470]|uniref:hypothetical protein n=1 Tax=unclassified Rhizobium TaxID=2613769 RepID=UPI001AB01203|nr:hypothetical protein [Rhizobium sp. T1473]MCA0800436.1 hypothetical protein [Rhizobium sp. T1473]